MKLFAMNVFFAFLCLSDIATAFVPHSLIRHIDFQDGGNRPTVARTTFRSDKTRLESGASSDVEASSLAAEEVAASPAALELKNELRRLSADTSNGVSADGDRRARIGQAAKVKLDAAIHSTVLNTA